jgi:hypothetical protein
MIASIIELTGTQRREDHARDSLAVAGIVEAPLADLVASDRPRECRQRLEQRLPRRQAWRDMSTEHCRSGLGNLERRVHVFNSPEPQLYS